MNILFVHQNFPGQFRHLAPALASAGDDVMALQVQQADHDNVAQTTSCKSLLQTNKNIHPWLIDMETKVIRGEAAYRAAIELRLRGFSPDIIIAHPGWGESLFLKDVWPHSKMALYCEYYYQAIGSDLDFDPEFFNVDDEDASARLRIRNAFYELQFPDMDAGISPTKWQWSTFPERIQSKISVIHDGIDTSLIIPDGEIRLSFKTTTGKITLSHNDEVITYVSRNLEPYRGYHIFMRALPAILKARPKARILIIGGDSVSYGPPPDNSLEKFHTHQSWKEIFLNEVDNEIDRSRVHFLGCVPYEQYLSVLQLSRVHVYLTYPFVLSWSLLEAMSAGCAIVGSDTAPVREVIEPGKTGRLVDFFDANSLAENVIDLCAHPKETRRLGQAARNFVADHYDLKSDCLPKMLAWIRQLSED